MVPAFLVGRAGGLAMARRVLADGHQTGDRAECNSAVRAVGSWVVVVIFGGLIGWMDI